MTILNSPRSKLNAPYIARLLHSHPYRRHDLQGPLELSDSLEQVLAAIQKLRDACARFESSRIQNACEQLASASAWMQQTTAAPKPPAKSLQSPPAPFPSRQPSAKPWSPSSSTRSPRRHNGKA